MTNLKQTRTDLLALRRNMTMNDQETAALIAAALPFAQHGWYDAELEDDSCPLTRHSGPITVGHWRALRAALALSLPKGQ